MHDANRDARKGADPSPSGAASAAAAAPPTLGQLSLVCTSSALPFVGFGFLDNFLMIMAGETIDNTLGGALGLSTMAAAGLGNLFSDVAGLGLADTIETMLKRAGVGKGPALTREQRRLPVIRRAKLLGSMMGVSVGCIVGMAPLLFWPS